MPDWQSIIRITIRIMNKADGLQLGDLLSLAGLEKPQNGVRVVLGQKGGNLLYREMSGLADRIEGSENVEVGEVRSLVSAVKENLEKMRVVYFGDELAWEEYIAIENLDENTKVCREVEKTDRAFGVGGMTYMPREIAVKLGQPMKYGELSFNNLKNLPVQIARELAKRKCGLSFPGLTEMSVELARELAELEGMLHLNSLKELSVEVAAALSKHKGSHLLLDGLEDMPAEVARELANSQHELSFRGIEKMRLEVARALSTHKGGLSLDGLETLSAEVAAELAKTGGTLQLWNIKKIDAETAQQLGSFCGYLGLQRLEDMDEEIAKGLANQQGILFLTGLKEFKPGVAAALGQHRGGSMAFHSVSRITEEDARGLAQHKDGMRLRGVEDLSEEAAKILGESDIFISGLPDEALRKVNKYRKEPLR